MCKPILTLVALAVLLLVSTIVSDAAEAAVKTVRHDARNLHGRHQPVARPSSDITSFSSSSALSIGVNHPPKNR